MVDIFGFSITNKSKGPVTPVVAPVRSEAVDGAFEIESGTGAFGPGGQSFNATIDFSAQYDNTQELINLYRTMALDGNVSDALEDIVNEAIVNDTGEAVVSLNMESSNLSPKVQDKVYDAFDKVVNLLDFNNMCHDLFKKWYVDGRMYAYKVLEKPKDNNGNKDLSGSAKSGLAEIRILDPRNVKFIREIDKDTGLTMEYFLYQDAGNQHNMKMSGGTEEALVIKKDAMAFIPSGDYDLAGNIISALHPAVKPYNQLTAIEDYTVIYRITRSTERRIFYIDVGELPKTKAEEYMQSIISKHKNKVTYDSTTGKMAESSNIRSMLEDVWLPRRDGGKGTEVDTLQGGQNLGEMDDVEYFRKKLYQAMHIPLSRLEVNSTFVMGRGAEITRDELKFNRYVEKLRRRFNNLFIDLLRTEVVLQNIMTLEEWDEEQYSIRVDYNEDAHFAEIKHAELMDIRLTALSNIDEYVGKYFSLEQIHKDVLRRSEQQIADTIKQIKQERKAGLYNDPDDDFGDEDEPVDEPDNGSNEPDNGSDEPTTDNDTE